MSERARPAVFLDKDGTLIRDVPYNVDPALVQLTKGAREGAWMLRKAGYALVVASNQSGVARGLFDLDDLRVVRARIEQLLGLTLDGFYCCSHLPDGVVAAHAIVCDCRKPRPGLLVRAARELGLDLARSWMVGDIASDVEAGRRAGCRTVLLASERVSPPEVPHEPTIVAAALDEAARRILLASAWVSSGAFTE